MQDDVNQLSDYFYNNSLTANVGKTKFIILSRNPNLNADGYSLLMNNIDIAKIAYYKYLGLTIQADLKWDIHIEHIAKKISSFLGPLYKCAQVLPVSTRLKLYHSYVSADLTYLNTIWCDIKKKGNLNKSLAHLQVIQNKCIRNIFKEEYYSPKNIDQRGNRIMRTVDFYHKYNILTLTQLNYKECCIMTHKILNKNIVIDVKLDLNKEIHNHNTRSKNKIHIYKVKTNIRMSGFIHRASVLFNALPNNLQSITNLKKFKKTLKNA